MAAVVLALSASLCWGVADFLGGTFSRRLPAVLVVLGLESGGLVAVALLLTLTGEPVPGATPVLEAAAAGIFGTAGLVCFFRGMAVGSMAVVAPVFASGTAVIPVVVGLARGERLGAVVGAGIALAAGGVLLASMEGEHGADASRAGRAAVGWALAGACGAAVFVVGSDAASDDSVAWTLLVARAAAVPFLAAGVALTRPRIARPVGRDVLLVGSVGLVDLAATACFGAATTHGQLAVVAVLGAMYPVVTAGLALVVHHERVRHVQLGGVACAGLGVALVAAG